MDLTFVANDTRGGVEPYLAVAIEAVSRGHRVRAAVPEDYAEDFRRAGIRFAPLRGVDRSSIAARSDQASLREMSRHVVGLTATWARDVRDLADGTDAIVSGIGGMAIARPVADALSVPLLRAHLQPLEAPSTAYPGALGARLGGLGRGGRRLSHALTGVGTAMLTRAPERAARAALGVSAPSSSAVPSIVYGFSPAVVPVRSDDRTTRVATGYWSLPHSADDGVSPDLRRFVEEPASAPVVSIGFGSMLPGDPARLFDVVVEAVTRMGGRAVLLTGWGGLTGSVAQDSVRVEASVPHAWLFPRVAATVHHGGAGTTGAALTAGVPTFIMPFGADQPFWAARAEGLGVAPRSVSPRRLTVDRLCRALDRMLGDDAMRGRAAVLGERLREESGTARAVDGIESALAGRS